MLEEKKLINLVVPAKPEYLSLVRLVVAAAAQDIGFSEDNVADIKVALSEAATNVVRHAYPSNLDHREQTINISCYQETNGFLVEVLDHGQGMPLLPPPSEGLGFGIMGSLMDKVDVETSDNGTTVLLIKGRAAAG